jgi:hypothetical protein
MTDYTGSFAPQDQPSTTDVARDQAANVGQAAAEAGSHVAQTASDQARVVVSETARQARDLLGEASGQAMDQASVQQQRAARQLRAVADELQDMAAKGGQSGLATEVTHQAAERIHGAASWLEQREPGDVLQAVRDFARRRPGVFLAGAAIAGLAAGRLTRGMTAAARSGNQDSREQNSSAQWRSREIPPPPDPDWTTPVGGYPADTVLGADATGTVTPGAAAAEPYYPAAGVPGPGAATLEGETEPGRGYPGAPDYPGRPRVPGDYPGEPGVYEDSAFQDRGDYEDGGPETYRPGQL